MARYINENFLNKQRWKGQDAAVIHCPTYEHAKELCRTFDKYNFKLAGDTSYLDIQTWSQYKENTCYDFANGKVISLETADRENRRIYSMNDCILSSVNPKDLDMQYYYDNAEVISFTGPRPKELYFYDKNHPGYQLIKYQIETELLKYKKLKTVYTGGAQGIDQIAFWAVDELNHTHHKNIKNNVILPFVDYDSRWSQDGLFGKADFAKLKQAATNVEYILNSEICSTENRKVMSLIMNRNEKLVHKADLLIAVTPLDAVELTKHKNSGTGKTFCEAIKRHVPAKVLQLHL